MMMNWKILVAALGFLAGAGTMVLADESPDVDSVRRNAVVQAVERAMPSVVNIATETVVFRNNPLDEIFSEFFGYRRGYKSYSVGSGVIVDDDGYILTNFHVIERASRVQVKLTDGREFEAEPVMYASGRSDIALLKIITDEEERFPAIRMADDDDLLLGETVMALGNPFGLGGSVSRGILSSKSRRPVNEDEQLGIADWLQTDAAVNPGNSGGPLINLAGELIGINVAVYRGNRFEAPAQGISFAIPVKRVREAISHIFVPETMHGLWFGARIIPGVFPIVLGDVQADSPADRAGLREGDRVVEVNGKIPDSFIHFNELIGSSEDMKAKVEVQREGRRIGAEVELMRNSDLLRARLGASLQELTPELARAFNVRPDAGLLVAGVDGNGPLGKVGIRKGFLIVGINDVKIHDLARAALIISDNGSGDEVVLNIIVPRQRGRFAPVYEQGEVRIKLR